MICVDKYYNDKLSFVCTECDKEAELTFSKPIEENSVEPIKVECPSCGNSRVLLVLKCKDEYMAKTLLAKFQDLKERYYG